MKHNKYNCFLSLKRNKFFYLFFASSLFSILSQAQCLNGGILLPPELVINGDFSSGNTGFNSSYAYCNTSGCEGPESTYGIGTNPSFYNGAFCTCGDHTTGTGNIMVVNGSGTANTSIWCETISVTPNTEYILSAWVVTLYPQSPAQLQFSINGVLTGSILNAASTTNVWTQGSVSWNSGANTSVNICIINQNTATGGNDFGLDDISLRACGCNFSKGYNTTICSGTNDTLLASGGSNYLWNTGATTTKIIVTPPSTTSYSVIISSGSCIDTSAYVVAVNTTPTLIVSNNITICSGNSSLLTVGGAVNYSWTPTGGLNPVSGPIVTASPTTTTNYIVTGDISGTCSATANVTVNVYPVPSVAIITNAGSCQGGGTVTLDGGNSIYYNSYLWSPSGAATETINVPASGSYTLTLSNSNCSTNITITLDVLPTISASPGTTVCLGNSTIISVTGGVSYIWSPTTGLNNPTGKTVVANPLTSTTYTIFGTNKYGCSSTGNVNISVSVNPLPTISINPSIISICRGSSTTMNANGNSIAPPINYLWQPITSLSSNTGPSVIISPAPTVTIISYTVTGTDQNGCYNIAGTTIIVNPLPTITSSANKTICQGIILNLSAGGGVNYTWSPVTTQNVTTGSTVITSPTISTTYTITGSDNNNCFSTSTIKITVQPIVVITVSADQTINQGTTTNLSATGNGASILWTPSSTLSCNNCLKPTADPTITTAYYITITSANGCQSRDSVLITVIPKQTCADDLFVPDAFSPNADLQNDVLYIKTKSSFCIQSMTFEIFDRWGNKVFDAIDINAGWDGKYKGKEMDPAVFVYQLQAILSDGSYINRKGNISLIK